MPSPSQSLSTLRPDLAEFYEFDVKADQGGFAALQVFPVIEAGLQSDNPGRIPLEQLLNNAETLRGSDGGYATDDFTFEKFTYATEEHGFKSRIDARDYKRYANILDVEQIATVRAYGVVLRNAEKRVADAVFNTTTWTGSALTTAVTNEWDDSSSATPIVDVEGAVAKVYDGSGLWPNALVINRKVFRNLRNCDEIINRINSAGAGNASKASDVTTAMLAQVFDLDHIIVAGGTRNTATEGQSASPGQIWSSEYAMVCRIATSNDMREPCIGRTFHWSEDGSTIGGTVEKYWDEDVRSDYVRVRHETDEVVMHAQAGHLLSNITT